MVLSDKVRSISKMQQTSEQKTDLQADKQNLMLHFGYHRIFMLFYHFKHWLEWFRILMDISPVDFMTSKITYRNLISFYDQVKEGIINCCF